MFKLWIYTKAVCLVLFYAFLGAIGFFGVLPLLGYYVWIPLLDYLFPLSSGNSILGIYRPVEENYVFCLVMSLGLTSLFAFAIGLFVVAVDDIAQNMIRRNEK